MANGPAQLASKISATSRASEEERRRERTGDSRVSSQRVWPLSSHRATTRSRRIDQNKSVAREGEISDGWTDGIGRPHRVNFMHEVRAHKWFPE